MSQTIANWLESLGLGQYAQSFLEHDIDMTVLSELSDEHLEQLGVSLGHRLKILKAVRTHNRAVDTPHSHSHSTSSGSTVLKQKPIPAERRQLSVMFVDLVGSTEMSTKLDPEDLRTLMVQYQKIVAKSLEDYGGHVARYMGDGVLAYFGWPQAHEDAAHRAVHAALSTVASVASLPERDIIGPLQTRVGVATGLVVVGDIIGTGEAREHAVIGETPNLAARLQGLAQPQQVVVSESTKHLVERAFEFDNLGMHVLKGLAEPVPAFSVRSVRSNSSRFGGWVNAEDGLFGREAEFESLLKHWRETLAAHGHLALVTGEAGIGKSALVAALHARALSEGGECIVCQCSPYESASALYPIIQSLPQWLGQWYEGVSPEESLRRLLPAEKATLLTEVIGRSSDVGVLSAKDKRELTLTAMAELVAQKSQTHPLLLLVEDAHWIDATSLEWLDELTRYLSVNKIFMVITARQEFEHHFPESVQILRLELHRLAHTAIEEIVRQVCGGKPMPVAVVTQIASRTDGVPLFVEEITKTLLESRQLTEVEDRYCLVGPLKSVEIPESLQDSLMARLERLQSARRIAQCAACIGREFNLELLAVASGETERSLQPELLRLIDAELVHESSEIGAYRFNHALVSDAAYESLLKQTRQRIHERIAQYMSDRAEYDGIPELIAHHYSAARISEKALMYWEYAADIAISTEACVEATAHIERALLELGRLQPEDNSPQRELALLQKLIDPLITSRSFADVRALEVVNRSLELGEQTRSMEELFPVLGMQIVQLLNIGRFPEALGNAKRYLKLAQKASDELGTIVARQMNGTCEFWCGLLHQSNDSYRNAIEQYEQLDPDPSEAAYYAVINPKSNALCNSARLVLILGYPDRAQELARQGIQFARETELSFSIGHALVFAGIELADMLRNKDAVNRGVVELEILAREKRFGLWETEAAVWRNRTSALSGNREALLSLEIQAEDDSFMRRCDHANIAQIYNSLGNRERSLHYIDMAIDDAWACGEKWYTPELYRIKGEILLGYNDSNDAIAIRCLERAIGLSQQMEAKWWELRAAISLSRHLATTGKRAEAIGLLEPIVYWFNEGFETQDLCIGTECLRSWKKLS